MRSAWQGERRISSLRQAIKVKKTAFEEYQSISREYEKLQAQKDQLDAKLAGLPSLNLRIPSVADALRVISQEIPEEIVLTSMDMRKSEGSGSLELQLQGLVYGKKAEAFPLVTKFMEQLEKAPVFSQVQLGGAGDEKAPPPASLAFEIGCTLK